MLASLLAGHFNYRFSRQIIGFDPDGMEALTQYPWPGNSAQFYRVLQQLSATCSGGMLSGDVVHTALAAEEKFHAAPMTLSGILFCPSSQRLSAYSPTSSSRCVCTLVHLWRRI